MKLILELRRKSDRPAKRRKAKKTLGEGCGGLDGGKCLESGTDSSSSAVFMSVIY